MLKVGDREAGIDDRGSGVPMGPAATGHVRPDRRVEDALDDEARQKMHDETRRGRPRDTVVATNRSSAVAFAELMIRSARPGGSMCSARHRASSASFCRAPFSSLGQTSPATPRAQPLVVSAGSLTDPKWARICARWYSAVRPLNW